MTWFLPSRLFVPALGLLLLALCAPFAAAAVDHDTLYAKDRWSVDFAIGTNFTLKGFEDGDPESRIYFDEWGSPVVVTRSGRPAAVLALRRFVAPKLALRLLVGAEIRNRNGDGDQSHWSGGQSEATVYETRSSMTDRLLRVGIRAQKLWSRDRLLLTAEAGPFWQWTRSVYASDQVSTGVRDQIVLSRRHDSELARGLDCAFGIEWPCFDWLSLHASYGASLARVDGDSSSRTVRSESQEPGGPLVVDYENGDRSDLEGWDLRSDGVRFGLSLFF